MAGVYQRRTSNAIPKPSDLPGFASARIPINESVNGLICTRDFYTVIPCSWLAKKAKKEDPDLAFFLPGTLNEEVFDLFFTLARIEKHKPSPSWDVKNVTILSTFDTYEGAIKFIKSLAFNDVIQETRFEGRSVNNLLSSVASLEDNLTLVDEPLRISQNHSMASTSAAAYYETFDVSDKVVTVTEPEVPPEHLTQSMSDTKADPPDNIVCESLLLTADPQGFQKQVMGKLCSMEKRQISWEGKLNSIEQVTDETRAFIVRQKLENGENVVGYKKFFITTTPSNNEVKANLIKMSHTFFKREVLTNCTTSKPSGTKKVFKTTNFYACLYDAYVKVYCQPDSGKKSIRFDEEILIERLRKIIGNSGDREGGRALRTKTDKRSSLDSENSSFNQEIDAETRPASKRRTTSVNEDTPCVSPTKRLVLEQIPQNSQSA
ncbi:hypothetical protein QAD02_009921 [Eretmocerus hayati]|uniref:Uncharacterized protein n=1 Tax=Eretmocerus hayati TaxID=131215 RepID=A0ACC2NAU7_9HYME|nr:hypothetical protein QAD02_009921 [Eretmocerus hayati]